jgi:hypothetical protein
VTTTFCPAKEGSGKSLLIVVVVLAFCTIRVKAWSFDPEVLLALMVIGYVPTVPVAGVPLKTPAVLRVTPVGSVPVVTVNVGTGEPVAITLKLPAMPAVKVVVFRLVIMGAEAGKV